MTGFSVKSTLAHLLVLQMSTLANALDAERKCSDGSCAQAPEDATSLVQMSAKPHTSPHAKEHSCGYAKFYRKKAGTCEDCPVCPLGQYRTDCSEDSEGSCVGCPTIAGPFKQWIDSLLMPCQYECHVPSQPDPSNSANKCSLSLLASCSNSSNGMIAHNKTGELLAMGRCAAKANQFDWGSQVVTTEAHCGQRFQPLRFGLSFLGGGADNSGQWAIKDCSSGAQLTVINKTLSFSSNSREGFNRFTFTYFPGGYFHLHGSGTQECLKVMKKPGFQFMNSPNHCDPFVFANAPVPVNMLAHHAATMHVNVAGLHTASHASNMQAHHASASHASASPVQMPSMPSGNGNTPGSIADYGNAGELEMDDVSSHVGIAPLRL